MKTNPELLKELQMIIHMINAGTITKDKYEKYVEALHEKYKITYPDRKEYYNDRS